MSLILSSALLAALQATPVEEQVGGEIVSRFQLEGESAYARFGAEVLSGADFNGDLIDDLVVSSDLADPGGLADAGSVFIYSGVDGSLILRLDGTVAGIQLGSAMAISEDMNNDQVADIVIGARGLNTPTGVDRGAVFVFSGANGSVIHRVDGTQDNAGMGDAVAALGDVNGDLIPDFAGGAQWFDNPLTNAGRVEVYSGVDGTVLWSVEGVHGNNLLGCALDGAGDLNGDLVPDLLIGDRGRVVNNRLRAGGAMALSGSDGALIFDIPGQDAFDFCGAEVCAVGDIDEDGVSDLAISSHNSSPSGRNAAGKVRMFSGGSGALIFPIIGEISQGWLGTSIAKAGDVNGDGFPDLLIGAISEDPGQLNEAGVAYVFSGRDRGLLFRINGEEFGASMGFAGVGAGDLDGDGDMEIAVAATGATVDNAGVPIPGAGTVEVFNLNPYLQLSAHSFSQSLGGTIDMNVDFPLTEANGDYVMLFTGLPPGITQFNGFPLPILFDDFTANAATNVYPPVFVNPWGQLDANGDCLVQLSVGPGAVTPSAIGATFRFCVLSVDLGAGMPLVTTIAQPIRLDP